VVARICGTLTKRFNVHKLREATLHIRWRTKILTDGFESSGTRIECTLHNSHAHTYSLRDLVEAGVEGAAINESSSLVLSHNLRASHPIGSGDWSLVVIYTGPGQNFGVRREEKRLESARKWAQLLPSLSTNIPRIAPIGHAII
jgi:hypothetical protein